MENSFKELGYVDAKTLAQHLGLSKIGLLVMAKRGDFPRGIKIGHARRWNIAEVKEWLNAQAQREVIA